MGSIPIVVNFKSVVAASGQSYAIVPLAAKYKDLEMNEEAQQLIKEKYEQIRKYHSQIDNIAKRYIPDFHFLNHKVSNFWMCEKSPIGWCVWDIRENGYNVDCQCCYCKGPVERK